MQIEVMFSFSWFTLFVSNLHSLKTESRSRCIDLLEKAYNNNNIPSEIPLSGEYGEIDNHVTHRIGTGWMNRKLTSGVLCENVLSRLKELMHPEDESRGNEDVELDVRAF
ncbi:hypothetical protein H5410_058474 [Solanum commersonii]|uniref:Uncharacterized protein n=1 Tax=Solanum commersonii TaxID=4109 RepID=A0A9J5WT80_SOLCO|nr:hypothetical protein H5410_058474 [Solanum commersonii]